MPSTFKEIASNDPIPTKIMMLMILISILGGNPGGILGGILDGILDDDLDRDSLWDPSLLVQKRLPPSRLHHLQMHCTIHLDLDDDDDDDDQCDTGNYFIR